jgi:adenylosuccinate synthase
MKKIRLTERDLTRIVRKIVRENKIENKEGIDDVWAGIKGAWRGHGYSYSKNMSKLEDIVQDLRLTDSYQEKIKKKCEEIVDDVANSKMPEEKSEQILEISNNIISIINQYNEVMAGIESEIKQVLK